MSAKLRVAALLATVLFSFPASLSAQGDAGGERVVSFLSEVAIEPDASLEVRTTAPGSSSGGGGGGSSGGGGGGGGGGAGERQRHTLPSDPVGL